METGPVGATGVQVIRARREKDNGGESGHKYEVRVLIKTGMIHWDDLPRHFQKQWLFFVP